VSSSYKISTMTKFYATSRVEMTLDGRQKSKNHHSDYSFSIKRMVLGMFLLIFIISNCSANICANRQSLTSVLDTWKACQTNACLSLRSSKTNPQKGFLNFEKKNGYNGKEVHLFIQQTKNFRALPPKTSEIYKRLVI
jgi:hypothetical protein